MPNVADRRCADASDQGKRSRRTAQLTERLLNTAVTEFGERGYEAANVADIARNSGLSTGAIYSRWRDKRALFLAAVEYVMSQPMSGEGTADQRPSQLVSTLSADGLTSSGGNARRLFLEACVIARRDDALRAGIAQVFDAEASTLSKSVMEGKAAGIFDDSLNTDLVVLCCQALSVGMLLTASLSEDRLTGEAADEWDELVTRVLRSWAPPNDERHAND